MVNLVIWDYLRLVLIQKSTKISVLNNLLQKITEKT